MITALATYKEYSYELGIHIKLGNCIYVHFSLGNCILHFPISFLMSRNLIERYRFMPTNDLQMATFVSEPKDGMNYNYSNSPGHS